MKYLLFLFFVLCLSNVKALTLDQTQYEAYGVKRAYVICDYAFDISKYNPTLKDLMLASQSCPTDSVTIYEIKISSDINGNIVRSYKELLSNSNLASFPALDIKHFYTGAIGTNNRSTIDFRESEVTHYIDTVSVNQGMYDSYNINRSYIVGVTVSSGNLCLKTDTSKCFSISGNKATVEDEYLKSNPEFIMTIGNDTQTRYTVKKG